MGCLVVVGLLVWLLAPVASAATLAQAADAVVSGEGNRRTWTVANSVVSLTLGFGADGSLTVQRLATPAGGKNVVVDPVADAALAVGGQALSLADQAGRGSGFLKATAGPHRTGVVLNLVFRLTNQPVQLTRHYAVFPRNPVIETWIDVEVVGTMRSTLAHVESWRIGVPQGDLDWVSGLQTPAELGGAFTRQHSQVPLGEAMTIGSEGRSTEQALPWATIGLDGHTLFSGIMWSGSWNLTVEPTSRGLRVVASAGPLSTALEPGAVVELPHVVFGLVAGDQAAASAAAGAFVVDVLRSGRPLASLVTYNTWFTFGTSIDEPRIQREMALAADLGVELFQLDAGWHVRAGEQGRFDFTSGLGTWRVDTRRFPGGLASLAARAHELGMRFGLWVDPEHVDLATIGQDDGPREEWLAMRDGEYSTRGEVEGTKDGQICLVHPEARAWMLEHLTRLVADNGVDYLKWDNNIWVNCNREGHGHGDEDGNFAHVGALYALLAELRARFPDLMVENCAGGGNRIDLGLAQYTDAAWMDDRTTPSAHVRHNLQGLSAMLPPAYLLSYVMADGMERVEGSEDLDLLVRSRMPGVLGFAFEGARLGTDTVAQLSALVGEYKRLRSLVTDGTAILLTDQASTDPPPPWDAIQTIGVDGNVALFVFQNDPAADAIVLKPQGLAQTAVYRVETLHGSVVATMTAAELLTSGFTAHATAESAAQVFLLIPQ